jgi:hypothetical protein
MRVAIGIGLLGSCGLAGCFTSLQQGAGVQSSVGQSTCVGAGCHHGAGGGSGGSSSSSTAATPSGSSSGSSGSGTSQGGSSSSGGDVDAGVDCPQLYVTSNLYDTASLAPVVGATVQAVGLNGVPLEGAAATSQSDGTFTVCVPPSVTFSLQVTAPGYPEAALEDLMLAQSETLAFTQGGLGLISNQDLSAFGAVVGYDPSMGIMLVQVSSISGVPPCVATGWQLSVSFTDGGALPDGGPLPYSRAYLDPVSYLPDSSLQATSSLGEAIFYDLDPNLTDRVAIEAVDVDVDAGACPVENGQFGLQGTALVQAGVLTFAIVPYP